jgi:hypothetical protein
MTNYSRDDSPCGRKYLTELHLLYRIENGELVSLGLYETRETAERELAVVSGDWKIADLGCVGWGIVDGVVGRNEITPTRRSRHDDGHAPHPEQDVRRPHARPQEQTRSNVARAVEKMGRQKNYGVAHETEGKAMTAPHVIARRGHHYVTAELTCR